MAHCVICHHSIPSILTKLNMACIKHCYTPSVERNNSVIIIGRNKSRNVSMICSFLLPKAYTTLCWSNFRTISNRAFIHGPVSLEVNSLSDPCVSLVSAKSILIKEKLALFSSKNFLTRFFQEVVSVSLTSNHCLHQKLLKPKSRKNTNDVSLLPNLPYI